MELDLGGFGLFYAWPEDVDISTVHENRRITASGTWRRVALDEDDVMIETEAMLIVTLEEFPLPGMTDPMALLSLPWEEYQVSD